MNKVVELPRATLSDIPRVLRAIADEIENGNYGTVVAGLVTLENNNGVLEIFGAGAADGHRALSLTVGTQQILAQRLYGVSTTD